VAGARTNEEIVSIFSIFNRPPIAHVELHYRHGER
jgi:hypothetical protein